MKGSSVGHFFMSSLWHGRQALFIDDIFYALPLPGGSGTALWQGAGGPDVAPMRVLPRLRILSTNKSQILGDKLYGEIWGMYG